MKKKAVFLVFLFCLAAVLSLKPASAESIIYFTAVNDRLLDLNDETMPVEINGTLYLPLSDFQQSSLGTYTNYEKHIATIRSSSQSLSFELGSGNTYDDTGKVYNFRAIYYNTGVYVPAIFTSQFFGFKFSHYSNSIGTFLRIRNAASSLSDDDFARIAALSMQSKLNVYLMSHTQSTPTPTFTTPPVTPSPEITTGPNNHANVFLSIRGIGDSTVSILNSLSYYDYKACFFVTAEEIKEYPDLVRRIVGSGQGIGILCSQNLSADYKAASAFLRQAAYLKTIIVALDCGYTSEIGNIAGSEGVIIWCDERMPVYGYNAGGYSSTIDYILENANGRLDLAISGDYPSLFREALSKIYTLGYSVSMINETANTYLYGV